MVHCYLRRQKMHCLSQQAYNLPSAQGHSGTHGAHHKQHSIHSILVSAAQQIQQSENNENENNNICLKIIKVSMCSRMFQKWVRYGILPAQESHGLVPECILHHNFAARKEVEATSVLVDYLYGNGKTFVMFVCRYAN